MEERIIMTSLNELGNEKNRRIVLEKKKIPIDKLNERNYEFVGSDSHRNFLINKENTTVDNMMEEEDITVDFEVISKQIDTENYFKEIRRIYFWYRNGMTDEEKVNSANMFLKDLFKEDNFPKNYSQYIKKVMEIMVNFHTMIRIELFIEWIGRVDMEINESTTKERRFEESAVDIILEVLGQSFPNYVNTKDLIKLTNAPSHEALMHYMIALVKNGRINDLGGGNWMRPVVHQNSAVTPDEDHLLSFDHHKLFKMNDINEMMNVSKLPTIAIITLDYCEKLAMDAMIKNKTTYVRQKTNESDIYTIGKIGDKHVVVSKIPNLLIKNKKENISGQSYQRVEWTELSANRVSTGNATTRLLGIFKNISHVIIVGYGGGVANFTNGKRHPRRGDVVVSIPYIQDTKNVYVYFQHSKKNDNSTNDSGENDEMALNVRLWGCTTETFNKIPKILSPVTIKILIDAGIRTLENSGINFLCPNHDELIVQTNNGPIEMTHPYDEERENEKEQMKLHYGLIAGGRLILKNVDVKKHVCDRYGILSFDTEMPEVIESIHGNRCESFIIIRGIADYDDGSYGRNWQAYASLAAAATASSIISHL
ncbi:hypothetical protein SNEBB_002917 [Seison nebaliae]|nr:hypothetical protein SNEBB_002917 [Seison nebaliae]